VRKQTMADMALMYAPENRDRIQVAYVSFTPESAKQPGTDLGYGFQIVKRLELPLDDGERRTIYVNEQWREEKVSKGLTLPDEIRIQTQYTGAAKGERRAPAALDLVRIAWNALNRDPQMARHTIYKQVNEKNELADADGRLGALLVRHLPRIEQPFADAFWGAASAITRRSSGSLLRVAARRDARVPVKSPLSGRTLAPT
jgi:hypothetical protein